MKLDDTCLQKNTMPDGNVTEHILKKSFLFWVIVFGATRIKVLLLSNIP